MTDPTEHLRLVKRAIRGNPDAYGQLIAGQQEYLYKMAFLYMKNKEDALDLVGLWIWLVPRFSKAIRTSIG